MNRLRNEQVRVLNFYINNIHGIEFTRLRMRIMVKKKILTQVLSSLINEGKLPLGIKILEQGSMTTDDQSWAFYRG